MKNLSRNIGQKTTKTGFTLLFGLISTIALANEAIQTIPPQPIQQGQEQLQLEKPTIEQPAPTIVQTKTEQATQSNNNTSLNPNLLNINSASAAEIQDKLIGIGVKKAQAIVDYREKNGKFMALEQLTEVSGIGKSTLEKNRDRIILE